MNAKQLIRALQEQRREHPAPTGSRHHELLVRLSLIDAGCKAKLPGKWR